ncbi:MAG: YifB family Mg chelatase-like AAA ATPase [Actinomycetota bacterium]|nr:YifB family Mg chelatase-like AAA ATPase [Actinomycetota bacterium]
MTESVAFVGADAQLVRVEVDIGGGVPAFRIVGLPNASVREAEQRVRSALLASNEQLSKLRTTANLSPGSLRKEGAHFDLALALAIAGADGKVKFKAEVLEGWVCVGELALGGTLRPGRGALAAAMAARRAGRRGLICPLANAPEAALVDDIAVVGVETLREALDFLKGKSQAREVPRFVAPAPPPFADLSAVRGHAYAKRALEVAAAGGHNLMMVGPPGSGKTMLAQRMPGLLPPMSFDESLEVTKLHSIGGVLPPGAGLVTERPFRAPHHNISLAGMVGGGVGLPRPGELSLAHHGTLFLDEITLYRRDLLESLRGPLEDGVVRIARSGGVIEFPCQISLIAAMNPCPCGFLGDTKKECRCGDVQIQNYAARLSGPLLDRMDLQAPMERLTSRELLGAPEGESSAEVRERVVVARQAQAARYGDATLTNASVGRGLLDEHVSLGPSARLLLGHAIENDSLSGRGLDRVLRVARTLADLEQEPRVGDHHIAQALGLRLEHTQLRAVS